MDNSTLLPLLESALLNITQGAPGAARPQLEKLIKQLKSELETEASSLTELKRTLDALATQSDKYALADRLIGYAVHDESCSTNGDQLPFVCNCGLTALIKKARDE